MSLKKIGAFLWVLVLVFGAYYVYNNAKKANGPVAIIPKNHDGREMVDIDWRRLPHIRSFELMDQKGNAFRSAEMTGKPYVISFFFAECPTICRDLNKQVCRLSNRFKNSDLSFVSISVKPKDDTPEVLREYIKQFEPAPGKWRLLTGKKYKIDELAKHQLNTVLDGGHHTPDMFLIDRWGRFRDRFTWDDKREIERFGDVAKQVLSETEPPLEEQVKKTRNVVASLKHPRRMATPVSIPWLHDFQLTDQNGKEFYSRDLTGSVWVASLFFTKCGSICPRQNAWLAKMQPDILGRNARIVSISTKPTDDSPDVLRQYAKSLDAQEGWSFLTTNNEYVEKHYVDKVASEYLRISSHGGHHASIMVVVDRWGSVRGKFDWQVAEDKTRMLNLIDELNQEKVPVLEFEVLEPTESP